MMRKSLFALVLAVIVLTAISIASAGEPYHQVNLEELPFICSFQNYMESGADGKVTFSSVVKEFSLDGKKIELKTDKLTKIGNQTFFIPTKSYGEVKVTFVESVDPNAGAILWLTASQAKRFKELRKGGTK